MRFRHRASENLALGWKSFNLSGDAVEAGPLDQLLGHSITYRIALGPHAGRKVFTLQTLPDCNEPSVDYVCNAAGFHFQTGQDIVFIS